MTHKFGKLVLLACVLYSTTLSWAADDTQLVITSTAGKPVCQSASMMLAEKSVKLELCVTQGNFSHDNYVLKIGERTLLKAIDDETTKGISSNYQNQKVNLKCVPQSKAPDDVSQEKIEATQKIMPKLSLEEAKKMAILMETVEIGRLCTVSAENSPLMTVQVLFE